MPWSSVWISRHRHRRKGATRTSGPLGQHVEAALDRRGRSGKRNDLDGRHHGLRIDHGIGLQGRYGDRLVGEIEAVDARLVEDEQAPALGMDVGPPRERLGDRCPRPGRRPGEAPRGLVLGHIARLEHGHDDALDAGRAQGGDVRLARASAPS